METYLICLAAALVGGLLLTRVTKLLHLPAVTAYLVAGLLLGPFCIGRLGLPGLGFNSLEQVEALQVLTQTALGFIAFTIGNEFRLGQLKAMGKSAIVIGILQAVVTTLLVDAILVGLHLLRPDIISIPCAITLGAIASATAPAATLMVVRQYKADGPLTRLLMLVVAIDDAVGLLLFSVSFGIATALANGQVSILAVAVEPIVEVVLSLGLGAVMGWLLHLTEQFFHSRSKRMSLSVGFVLLTVGLSTLHFEVAGIHCGFSLLLVCMMTGTVFCNICPTSEELMERIEGWTAPLNILFFVLSESPVKAADLAALINYIQSGKISSKMAKEIFVKAFESGKSVKELVESSGASQISDESALEAWAKEALAANPKAAADVKAGNGKAIGALVGAVMRMSKGKANPAVLNKIFMKLING